MVRRRSAAVALALAASLASGAGSADAAKVSGGPHRAHSVGTQAGAGFSADGARFAAFNRDQHTIRVFDSRRRRTFDIASECALSSTPGVAGRFVVRCPQGDAQVPQLLDVGRRRIDPIPGPPARDTYYEMGRHWLRGRPEDGKVPYINWRSGEHVDMPLDERRAPLDIDSPGLEPIEGLPTGIYVFGREDGRTLFDEPSGPLLGSALQLWGRGRRIRLAKACGHSPCGDTSGLTGGRVGWTRPASDSAWSVRGYSVRSRKRVTWRVEGLPDSDAVKRIEVGHTSNTIVFGVLTGTRFAELGGQTFEVAVSYRIYAARW